MFVNNFLRFAVILSCSSSLVFAQTPAVNTTGVFSDLEYYEEGGDLVGTELFIFIAGGHMVLFQESLGEPMQPHLVKANVNGDRIEFSLPDDSSGEKRVFNGKFTKTGIIGNWVGSNEKFELPLRKSYWQ